MIRIVAAMLLAACGLLVVYAEGLQWIALWNLFPLAWAGLPVLRGADRMSWGAVAFAGVVTLAIGLTHAAWVFDWGGTQTGSSTAGLVFLVSPIYSIFLGGCAWAAAAFAERTCRKGHAARQGVQR